MIENYKFFVGKTCTILTKPVGNVISDARSSAHYFSGLVTDVNEHGVWIKNLVFQKMGFFPFPIVGIVEEQGVSKSDPNYNKIKEEVEQIKNPPAKIPQQYMTSVEDLTRFSKEIRKKKD